MTIHSTDCVESLLWIVTVFLNQTLSAMLSVIEEAFLVLLVLVRLMFKSSFCNVNLTIGHVMLNEIRLDPP